MNPFYHLQAGYFRARELAAEAYADQLKTLASIRRAKGYGQEWLDEKTEALEPFNRLNYATDALVKYLFELLEGVIQGQVTMPPTPVQRSGYNVDGFLDWLEHEATWHEIRKVIDYGRELDKKLALTRGMTAEELGSKLQGKGGQRG